MLRGFDLNLRDKQIEALVGESNQGKSTVLNVIAGEQAILDIPSFLKNRKYTTVDVDS